VSSLEINTLPDHLIAIAREAGQHIMDVYQTNFDSAKLKKDGSPVTEADLRAERVIIPALKKLTPEIRIVSEENPDSHNFSPTDRFWLVDPLDGTKEFLKHDGRGAFTVNIALIEQRQPILGVVFAPALDRMFYGHVSAGAYEISENERTEISVSSVADAARIAVVSASHRHAITDDWLEQHGIVNRVNIGSSLKFCLIAAGEAHVYPRFGPTMEWDTAAGDAVLRAAGGITTTPEGAPFLYGKAHYKNSAFIAWNNEPST